MNRSILLCAACVAVMAAGSCSNEAPATGTGQGTGGSQGSGGSSSGSGGTSNTGGSQSGSGGTSSGSGGSDTGGSSGTGGDAAGGTSGTGGDATGGGGGGTGGGGTGGNGGGVTPAAIVPTLDGFLWVGTCADAEGHGKDCPILGDDNKCATSTDFNQRGAFRHSIHTVGGTKDTKYLINFETRGVTGGKNYNNGTRQSTATTFNQTGNDGWQVGGEPTDSKWNTYEIHVSPPVPGQPVNAKGVGGTSSCPKCPTGPDNVYYTNSILKADGVHETFPINFKASFPVLGGGTITLVIHDSNCLGQQNCGPNPDPNAMCTDPRTIDISGMSPAPTPFEQPFEQAHAPDPWHPQWLLFDVQTVTQP